MKALIFLICLLSVSVSAALITIDPDEFAAGTDISHAWAGVTLSSGGGALGLNGKVYTATSTIATTGTLVFANNRNSPKLWLNMDTNGYYLRVDFATPANHVLIDAISDGGTDYPSIGYYTTGGDLVEIPSFSPLGPGQSRLLEITRPTADIVYIRVGGYLTTSQYAILLDNLRYEVPEPASCLLLLSGWLLLKTRKK
jgi:hypothetical protein